MSPDNFNHNKVVVRKKVPDNARSREFVRCLYELKGLFNGMGQILLILLDSRESDRLIVGLALPALRLPMFVLEFKSVKTGSWLFRRDKTFDRLARLTWSTSLFTL